MNAGNSRITLISVSALILLLTVACAPCCFFSGDGNEDNNKGGTGSVRGSTYITTNEGKETVGKLEVTIGTRTVTSNEDGTFEVTGLNPGTYDVRIAGGDLGYSGKVTVRAGETTNLGELALHGTLPPPDGSTSETYPSTPEDVIRAYYKAINEQDYSKAKGYTTGNMAKMELDAIRGQYEPYVKNIKIVTIERRTQNEYGEEMMYQVTFDAEYIKHYEAGSGNLPEFHTLVKTDTGWQISGIGTGP